GWPPCRSELGRGGRLGVDEACPLVHAQRLASKNARGPASTLNAWAEYSWLQGRLHESRVLGALWYSGLSELRHVSTKKGSARRARPTRPELARNPLGARQFAVSVLKKRSAAGTVL